REVPMPSSVRPRAWGVIGAVTLLFLAAGADSIQAQVGGTIRGRATEQVTQRPLGGVRVQLVGANQETRADETGTFTFRGLPAGAYTLRATLIGYTSTTAQATVTPG